MKESKITNSELIKMVSDQDLAGHFPDFINNKRDIVHEGLLRIVCNLQNEYVLYGVLQDLGLAVLTGGTSGKNGVKYQARLTDKGKKYLFISCSKF